MLSFYQTLEQSSFSSWLLSSNSIWAYPTVLTVHTGAMMMMVGVSWMVDLRLVGFGKNIPLEALKSMFKLLWIAFPVSLATGTALFVADASKRGTSVLFLIKMLLILAALLLMRVLRSHLSDMDPTVVSGTAKRLAFLSMAVWALAVTAGRLLAYI